MSRKEFLKRFVALNKKHNVPLCLIKAQLYVILLVCFIHYAIVKGIRAVKYAICYPFVKLKNYIQKNIRIVFQVECIVATIGICFLVISQNGSLDTQQKPDGALAGESYAGGDIMAVVNDGDTDGNDVNVNEIITGSVSNSGGDIENTQETEINADGEQETDTDSSNLQNETTSVQKNLLPYRIMVNRLANCITIYVPDENGQYTIPYKAMICSTGGEETPAGTFKISTKYEFKELFYKSYGQYCSRIYGSILFHSSGNNSLNKSDLNAEDFNSLGQGVSHGCIRLTVEDAKWIHDNCPSGTEVIVYDSENPGPLGKPECIKVPAGTTWDPTDPDENNPWKDKQPWIEGAENRILYDISEMNYLEGIKAYDTCGNDITEDIVVEGTVDLTMPGEYVVTYSVIDLLGRTAECTVIYTVR